MASSKKAMRLRPADLARYMAVSASRSRSSICWPALGNRVMPMLPVLV